MAAKRTRRTRAIPPTRPTGAEERAAVAAKGERYVVDVDGERGADGLLVGHTMHFAIRDSVSGDIVEHCKSGKTEAHERAAQWNRGPTRGDNISWGKLQRTIPEGSAAWWVERLCGDPLTGPELQRRVDSGRALSLDDIKRLLARTTRYQPHLDLLDDPTLLERVSSDLARYFSVRRSDEGRLAQYNDPDSWPEET